MVEKFRIKALNISAEKFLEKSKNTERGMIIRKVSEKPLIYEYSITRPRFAPKTFLKFVTKEAIEISVKKNLDPLIINKDYELEIKNE